MMDGVDQFGVGAVFQEYGEHLTAEGEVKEQLRGTTRLDIDTKLELTIFFSGS